MPRPGSRLQAARRLQKADRRVEILQADAASRDSPNSVVLLVPSAMVPTLALAKQRSRRESSRPRSSFVVPSIYLADVRLLEAGIAEAERGRTLLGKDNRVPTCRPGPSRPNPRGRIPRPHLELRAFRRANRSSLVPSAISRQVDVAQHSAPEAA